MLAGLNRLIITILTSFVGIFVTAIGIYVSRLPIKFSIALALAMIFLCIIIIFSSYAQRILLASIAFSIPINADINFLVIKHVGSASSISISVAWILTLMLLLLIFINNIANRKFFLFPVELIVIISYFLWGISGLLVARYPGLLFLELIRLLMLAIVVFTIAQIKDSELLRTAVTFLLAALLIQSLIAALQYLNVPGTSFMDQTKGLSSLFPDQRVNRAMGTLSHPNFLAYFLELLTPMALVLFLAHEAGYYRIFSLICWISGTFALILTKSRGAWAAYPVGISVVLFLWFVGYTGRRILERKIVGRVFAIAFIGFLTLVTVAPVIKGRLFGEDYRAAAVRMPLNKAALSVFEEFPITGVGMNNFSEVFKIYDRTGFSRIFRGYKHVVHNMYLLIAVEAGLPGLLLLVIFLMLPFFYSWKKRYEGCQIERALSAALIGICGGLAAHMIHCLVDPGFMLSRHTSFLVFFLIALSGAIYRSAPEGY
ncbi:O-antigen ligase family protein [Thermodesulforhabdus norvegica]|uniref:O-antigen ligase n=1 Tax=Thermodesulforhabdus norvegica TaxID=39841 RepID=A0A1I4WBB3_9BACT|nr:O-antigen ligase family protein [Thermodesulforhabdus norvegica]SFN11064.1 O-antigen ligase [Thermodesulforhabdus norvegica]